MNALLPFVIPFSGLGNGVHEFDFEIDQHFFHQFEASPIKEGKVDVKLYFDKRPQMFELTFIIKGVVLTNCDRCLEDFNLPISGTHSLLVKFAEQASEDAEVVFLAKGSKVINIAKYVYEFILLSIPIIKTHDQAEEACDEEMLTYLEIKEPENEEASSNSTWDALKDFKEN